MRLNELLVGEYGRIKAIHACEFSSRLNEFGVMEELSFEVTLSAPFNGPMAIHFNNTTLSIRREDAAAIEVEKVVPPPFENFQ
ncbi:MAG: ferrous iron transport protein A [Flavobacteriales bacterium]|jgi:Fe2+ transport system protein FeoA